MIILILNDPSSITHLDIRRLVQQRFSEIEDCQAILVELGDSIAALEQAIEWPIRHNLFNDTHYGNEDYSGPQKTDSTIRWCLSKKVGQNE